MIKVSIRQKNIQESVMQIPTGVTRYGMPFKEMPKAKTEDGKLEFDVMEQGGSILLYLTTNQTAIENAIVTIAPIINPNPLNLGQRQRMEKYKNTIGEKPYFVRWIKVADDLQGKRVGSLLYQLAVIKAKKLGATHLCSDKRRSKTDETGLGSDDIWSRREREGRATFFPTVNRYCIAL